MWGGEAGKLEKGSLKGRNEPMSRQQMGHATKGTVKLAWLRYTPMSKVFNIALHLAAQQL